MANVVMPQLGETVTEGTITRWLKKVGDTVAADDVLFEVSTDKVDSEVPAPEGGVLSEIRVQEGETADVGAVLAVIGSEAPAAGAPQAADEPTSNGASVTSEPEPAPEATNTTAPAVAQEEAAQQAPAPAPSPTANPAPAPAASAPSDNEGPGLGGRVLSPVVRKLIRENGLDASQIAGTGAGGRITRDDVQNHLAGNGNGASVAPAQAPASGAAPAPAPSAPRRPEAPRLPVPAPGESDVSIPFSNIRRRTAEHMVASKATSAHTLVTIEVDYANVDKVRKKVKDRFKAEEGVSLTYLPFITRALVDALRDYPYVNASVGNDELIVHRNVNVGIAVDLDFEGLLVPVVKSADGLRLRQIARSIADLAYRARNKKLQADDISGGTFTITNAGGYGTFITYPVINQPQVAILSTDGVKKRPVAIELPDGSDAVVVHPVGLLGLAWDHRAFDGAYASAFLARVKEVLETRDWSAEL